LLQRSLALKVIHLGNNELFGPLGARALAPALTAAASSHLEWLDLCNSGLGIDGVANLVPVGQGNMSLPSMFIIRNGRLDGETARTWTVVL
jgi:hypothetical protein